MKRYWAKFLAFWNTEFTLVITPLSALCAMIAFSILRFIFELITGEIKL